MTDIQAENTLNKLSSTVSLWRLYVLMVSTLGLYVIFWFYKIAKDLYSSQYIKGKPVWWAIGMIPPGLDAVLFFIVVRKWYLVAGFKLTVEFYVIVLILGVLGVVSWWLDEPAYVFSIAVFYPLPVLVVQYRINQYKKTLPSIEIEQQIDGFTERQWYAISVGVIFLVFYVLTLSFDIETPASEVTTLDRGSTLDSGSTVTGTSELYRIQLPDGSWQRFPNGTMRKGTDIELRETKSGLKAWVYVVKKDGDSFVERINWRRKNIIDGKNIKSVAEKRFLISDEFLMSVSHSYYKYKKDRKNHSWWIKTIDTGRGLVELLVYSANASSDQPMAEQLFENIQVIDTKKTLP